MTNPKDPAFDLEAATQAARSQYEQWRLELHDQIAEYADDNGIGQGMLCLLLIDLGVTARMVEYAMSVDKPSGSGLKLDLDRLRREFDDFLRSSKKSADEFVRASIQALAEEARQAKKG